MKIYKVVLLGVGAIGVIGTFLAMHSLRTVERLGHELLKVEQITDWKSNRNSPINGLVNIGDGLYGIITTHQVPLKQLKVKSQLGDCFNASNTISHSIVITSPKATLCIRLRFDPTLFKYHIVGYSGDIN